MSELKCQNWFFNGISWFDSDNFSNVQEPNVASKWLVLILQDSMCKIRKIEAF